MITAFGRGALEHGGERRQSAEAEREAGGIYLFESKNAAQSYVDSPITLALEASPVISNINAKLFDVMESHRAITRDPADNGVAAAA